MIKKNLAGDKCMGRNASDSEFGWQFQVVVGIELALQNIEKTKWINIEGPLQDVELKLSSGHSIFAQAKSYARTDVDDSNNTSWSTKLESGIIGLFEDFVRDSEDNEYKYLVNYPFPLGKNHGGKSNFRPGSIGEIQAVELSKMQLKIIKDILLEARTDSSESKIIKELSETLFETKFEQFIQVFSVGTCEFTNFVSNPRKFNFLDTQIKEFLVENNLDVSYQRLRRFWMDQGFNDATNPVHMSRTEFLFPIFLSKSTVMKMDIFGRRVGEKRIAQLYDRFLNIIETLTSSDDFNRQLEADVLTYFHLGSIEDYAYDDAAAEEFVDSILSEYLHYFKLRNLQSNEQRELTRFALARCLEEQVLLNKIYSEGGMKSVPQ
ncbi:hypothetical protein GPK34_03580 [Secundilactobacillus kimchicus]|uniref:hypothetical protein n=1 Tax=Secundilactobacillus kimchicus TaxID=528209 RepID=UPI001C02BFE0|nr:hypothetical protein [Secundilactobacillus kimchicus]MBT9671110.1 hypothetical protein [Secundilactobacillus kimchicus]